MGFLNGFLWVRLHTAKGATYRLRVVSSDFSQRIWEYRFAESLHFHTIHSLYTGKKPLHRKNHGIYASFGVRFIHSVVNILWITFIHTFHRSKGYEKSTRSVFSHPVLDIHRKNRCIFPNSSTPQKCEALKSFAVRGGCEKRRFSAQVLLLPLHRKFRQNK